MHLRILNGKVEALIGLKEFTEAISTCEQAIELVVDDKQWLIDLIDLKIAALQGRKNKALKDSEQIAKLKEECKRLEAELAEEEKENKEQEKETEEQENKEHDKEG